MPEIGLGHEASIRGQRSSKGLAFSQKPPKVLFLTKNLPTLLVPKQARVEPGAGARHGKSEDAFCCALESPPHDYVGTAALGCLVSRSETVWAEFPMWKTGGNPVLPIG